MRAASSSVCRSKLISQRDAKTSGLEKPAPSCSIAPSQTEIMSFKASVRTARTFGGRPLRSALAR